MFLFLVSLARFAQMPFHFQTSLRTLRKPVFVLKRPCARCANLFLFQNTLARHAQALYFSISPLRTPRKRKSSSLPCRSLIRIDVFESLLSFYNSADLVAVLNRCLGLLHAGFELAEAIGDSYAEVLTVLT